MTTGTKSVLFGVHAFWWHPIMVLLAWRHIYREWPTLSQCIVIFCHDLGYWGKSAMDSPDGKTHPIAGSRIACRLVYLWSRVKLKSKSEAFWDSQYALRLSLFHSKHYADLFHLPVSELYLPDKACVLFEPNWFYLIRARLSGEITEYVQNSPFGDCGCRECEIYWFRWYKGKRAVNVSDFFLKRLAEYL